eukprot:EG_transcript_39559
MEVWLPQKNKRCKWLSPISKTDLFHWICFWISSRVQYECFPFKGFESVCLTGDTFTLLFDLSQHMNKFFKQFLHLPSAFGINSLSDLSLLASGGLCWCIFHLGDDLFLCFTSE